MPTFKYRAKNGSKNIEGLLVARDREDAVEKLHQMNYIPVRIEQTTQDADKNQSKARWLFLNRVRSRDITLFSRQLASLTKSGVGILSALTIIARQSSNPLFKNILNDIQNEVKNGNELSSAIARHPKTFSPLYIAMVRSGEASGMLEEILVKLADYRQKQDEIFSRVRSALAYPVLMGFVGTGTIFFMLTFVMPRLRRVFERVGQELPLPTQILLSISSILQQWWVVILIVLGVIILLIKQGAKTDIQKNFISRLQLRLPIVGSFIHKNELARFSRTLELLIRSGIPILKAIGITAPIVHNELIKTELKNTQQELEQGGSLGNSLQGSKLFPEFMTSLIIVGEKSGGMDEALAEVATSYERDTDEAIKMMISLLEPIMILVMGIIVGFIVIAMLLPIFQMDVMA
ncbi:MAG: type II secretion system F family protein, partial [Candidatus Omnitrophica bacterium]|nr:type II secretion system F family protein [Candidatus Omnitrophota bacterium]